MREKIRRTLPWLVLAAAYVVSVGFIALYGAHNINADDASEMILASLLNDEGALLSQSWLYSTELRLLSPVPLYQLGLMLFSSWHAARTFAIAIVVLGVAASFLFMARQFGLKRSAPWLATILVLPVTSTYAYVIVYRCYYAIHLMLSFILLGLVSRCGKRGMKKEAVSAALLAVLGLLCGLNGVRMFTMLIVPMLGASLLMTLCACRRYPTFRGAAHEPAARMFAASLLVTIMAGAGYLVNMKVLHRLYSFIDYTSVLMCPFEMSGFLKQIDYLMRDLGYRSYVSFFSLKSVSCWLAIGILMMGLLALWRLKSRWGELAAEHRLMMLTAVLAVLLGILLNVLLEQLMPRYFIVGTILMVVLIGVALETEPCANGALRTLALIFVTGCFALQAGNTMRYDYVQGEVNYEMAADWLVEHGYTQGYAGFWNCNMLTEASDGQIEMWVLADRDDWVDDMEYSGILQLKRHLTEDPEGRVFLIVDERENELDSPLLDEAYLATPDLVAWTYYVYEYESAEEMRRLLEQGAE